jgi:ethanolamine phosphate transferase 2 subunit G
VIKDYLGLDHIGHVEGPFSKLVPSKLKEMDEVIKTIHEKLKDWVRKWT